MLAATWLAVVGIALTGSTARAQQQPSPEDTAAARALFEQGMDAVDARDFQTAADRLGRSLEIRDSVVVRANLALALVELGRFVEASEHLRQVQRTTEAGSDAHTLATTRLEEIAGRTGQLQIDLSGPVDGVEVRLDGRALQRAAIGVAQPADPGERRVTLHRGAREVATAPVTVSQGQLASVALVVPPLSAEEIAEAEADTRIVERERIVIQERGGGVESEWWFWTLIGVVVAGAAAGLIAWAVIEENAPELVRGSSGNIFSTLVEFP